jgi:hypothetical protein
MGLMTRKLIRTLFSTALMSFMVTLLFCIFGSSVWAFGTYDGCEQCHGSFPSGTYTSLQDGSNWGNTLMERHIGFVDQQCNACHKAGGRGEVYLNSSLDSTFSKSCVGCHGRDEDVTGNCTDLSGESEGVEVECGSGAGLRLYHESQVGAGTCNDCHDGDATPVGEHTAPFNYGQVGIAVKDACNSDGSESQVGPTGLDNDGDGQRDGNDSDCQDNRAPTQPGELEASAVTASSATVQWGASSDDEGDPISYQVDYRLNGEMMWSDGGSTSDTSQPLSGLDAGREYDARVTPSDGFQNGNSRTALSLFKTESGDSEFTINVGHSGAWYNPDTPGQGQLIDVEPESKFMFLAWFTFTDADSANPNEQHWFTAQGNYSGSTADLLVYETLGGRFDDPQEVTTDPVGEATLSFTDCGLGQMSYVIDTWDLQGEFSLQRAIPGTENVCEERAGLGVGPLDPNDGWDVAWFDAQTPGQGFLMDAHPNPDGDDFIFVAWFTFGENTASGQRWLTAQGPLVGSIAQILVYETTGGSFDDPKLSETNEVGTLTVDFTDCSNAQLTYSITDEDLAGLIDVKRAIPGTEALCEELAGSN